MNSVRKHYNVKWLAGIIVAAVILVALFLGLTQWKIIPVSTEGMACLEISRYPDGRMLFLLDNPELEFASGWEYQILEDGSCYLIPKRAVLEMDRSWDANVLNQWQYLDFSEMQPKAGGGSITACYIGTPDRAPVLIYEEGMEVPYVGYESPWIYGFVQGTYDEILDSFRGHWIIDRSQSAEISIERYIGSGWDIHPELFQGKPPAWIISLTGGAMLTDKDVVGTTYNSVLFFQNGYYFELRHTESGGMEYTWGDSSDNLNEVIRCEAENHIID